MDTLNKFEIQEDGTTQVKLGLVEIVIEREIFNQYLKQILDTDDQLIRSGKSFIIGAVIHAMSQLPRSG